MAQQQERVPLAVIAREWGRIGCIGFGGPPAHIALLRTLCVKDRGWLTATEFELLRFLMRNPRRVLSKAQILDRVWNYDFGGQAHVVELYISYLRKKVDAGRTPLIHTVRGVGYVLKPAS